MNHQALISLRAKLAADSSVYGLWITLESPSITEMAVALGLDWVVIDAEHGHLDWAELVAHVRCTVRSSTVCLIRIATLDAGLIKRALDIGADGVVVPWMESAQQLASARHAASYPPHGRRGIGAERATAWSRGLTEHVAQAEDILVVPIIESVDGGRQAAAMAAVAGIELFFIGPADWSATAGAAGQWTTPEVSAQISCACQAVRSAGKHVGVIATSDADLRQRRRDGFRMLGLGIDGALLLRAIDGMLPATGTLRTLSTDLRPHPLGLAETPLRELPASIAGERRPRHLLAADAPTLALDDRALVTTLVGRSCAARGLIAAVVRFSPGGALVRHLHPQPETVVVISGAIITEMDGVRHRLEAGAAITIPAGKPHRTGNATTTSDAVIHVAMPCDQITRTVHPGVDAEDPRPAPAGAPVRVVVPAAMESCALIAIHEHAGPADPGAGIRCRSLLLGAGPALLPRVHAVDAALVVVAGGITVRTASEIFTIAAGDALHLPRGTPHQITACAGAAQVIETCADQLPLDAVIDAGVLMAWPAAPTMARAS